MPSVNASAVAPAIVAGIQIVPGTTAGRPSRSHVNAMATNAPARSARVRARASSDDEWTALMTSAVAIALGKGRGSAMTKRWRRGTPSRIPKTASARPHMPMAQVG